MDFTADDRSAVVCISQDESKSARASCARLELATGTWQASLPVEHGSVLKISSPVELRSEPTSTTRFTGERTVRACRGAACTKLDTNDGWGVVSRDGRRAVLIEGGWYPSGAHIFDTTTGAKLAALDTDPYGGASLVSLGDSVYMTRSTGADHEGVVFDWNGTELSVLPFPSTEAGPVYLGGDLFAFTTKAHGVALFDAATRSARPISFSAECSACALGTVPDDYLAATPGHQLIGIGAQHVYVVDLARGVIARTYPHPICALGQHNNPPSVDRGSPSTAVAALFHQGARWTLEGQSVTERKGDPVTTRGPITCEVTAVEQYWNGWWSALDCSSALPIPDKFPLAFIATPTGLWASAHHTRSLLPNQRLLALPPKEHDEGTLYPESTSTQYAVKHGESWCFGTAGYGIGGESSWQICLNAGALTGIASHSVRDDLGDSQGDGGTVTSTWGSVSEQSISHGF